MKENRLYTDFLSIFGAPNRVFPKKMKLFNRKKARKYGRKLLNRTGQEEIFAMRTILYVSEFSQSFEGKGKRWGSMEVIFAGF